MSITDELREWAEEFWEFAYSKFGDKSKLFAIADRIDAEHEAACAEAYGNGVQSVPIALDESQWVKLPVDADGIPVNIGDEIYHKSLPKGGPCKVCGIGEDSFFYRNGAGFNWFFHAHEVHHHHAPTVEDVLREFADLVRKERVELATIGEGTIAEYAAKLRLANSEE